MNYTSLTIDQLFGRYFVNEAERVQIDEYVNSLDWADIEYFDYLKLLNDVNGDALATLEALQSPKAFTIDERRHVLYDEDNFVSSRGYIDRIMHECDDSKAAIPFILDAEREKAKARLAKLKEEAVGLKSLVTLKANALSQNEIVRFIDYLDSLSKSPSVDDASRVGASEQPKLTQRALALYCFYLQETGIMAMFDNMEGGKVKALKRTAEEYGFNSPKSWKSFQAHYNTISKPRLGTIERIEPNHIKSLEIAVSMLAPYPEALSIAEKELETARTKR